MSGVRVIYEVNESWRIALAQIRAHKLRSLLTALGVIIGIVAVTLMGTAINGIDIGFDRSMAMLGEDILYVQKWPWHNVEDWWNYANRPPFHPEDADALNRIFDATGKNIHTFTLKTTWLQKLAAFRGIKHRFNDSEDIAMLFQSLASILEKQGSLNRFFLACFRESDNSIGPALQRFAATFIREAEAIRGGQKKSFAAGRTEGAPKRSTSRHCRQASGDLVPARDSESPAEGRPEGCGPKP